jgi:SAM-dependent methyltransferase
MNKKIFAQLLAYSQNDLDKITQPYVMETFGVVVKRCETLEEYTQVIDDACLHKYFSKYWQNDMKKWKYSGVALIDEVNNLKPRAVLDVGCGYNEFKGKINNLIGIDPYNDRADLQVSTLNYKTDQKFDVILCLGSVNFGNRDKIIAEVGRCVNLLANGGTMFFRVNPGIQHDKTEAKWIESGYQGESEEEIVDRWFQTLCRTIGNEQGIDVTGSGYVQINRRDDGKTEVS